MIKILKIVAFTLLSMVSLQGMAQDLVAKQASIDKKIRGVDSLTLQRLIVKEQGGIPSASLYGSWKNNTVRAYSDVLMPEKYVIDLRGFVMPTTSRTITSTYGQRWGRPHEGLDLKVYVGDTIRAAFSGMVRIVDYQGDGYGKFIVIRHENGLETVYGHLSAQLVRPNQMVEAGEVIGLGGNTGRSTGSHLHFETRLLGNPIDPALLFDFESQDVVADTYTYHRGYQPVSTVSAKADSSEKKTSQQEAAPMKSKYHKVHKGDTLSSIAREYGMTVAQLCSKNGIKKDVKLQIGQIIKCS